MPSSEMAFRPGAEGVDAVPADPSAVAVQHGCTAQSEGLAATVDVGEADEADGSSSHRCDCRLGDFSVKGLGSIPVSHLL